MSRLVLALLAAAGGSVLLAPTARAQQGERFTLAGDSMAVYNLVGQATVEPGSGAQVVVTVRRAGADAANLRVERGPVRGRQTLRVLYPEDRIRYAPYGRGSRTETRIDADGTWGHSKGHGWLDGGRRVVISGDRGMDASADLRIEVPAGRAVAVYQGVGRITARNVNGRIHLDGMSAGVSATAMRGTLTIDVGSGDVSVTGMRGELNVDTGSGEVEVRDVVGRDLVIDTGSGGVTGADLSTQRLNVDTGSGDVALDGVRAPEILIDTGSGSVGLTLVTAFRSLDIDTGSGDVTVRVPGELDATVAVETSSGDIRTDFTVTGARREEGELHGRIGRGQGTLAIETGSGDVQLLRR